VYGEWEHGEGMRRLGICKKWWVPKCIQGVQSMGRALNTSERDMGRMGRVAGAQAGDNGRGH
jgi:hypothetical protein